MSRTADAVTEAARTLAREAEGLAPPARAHTVYNPLRYAWPAHARYISLYAGGTKRVLFVGMNPGPWGMAQTGVPFGEVNAVRQWLGISAPVGTPEHEHPARPVRGLECPRSEVSGRRLWGLFSERYPDPNEFFREHFVANYCPLVFMEESGKNITPDKLGKAYRQELYRICDAHLHRLIEALQPDFLIGVGKFAETRLKQVVNELAPAAPAGRAARAARATPEARATPAAQAEELRVGSILHPSPASPQANRGWAEQARRQLADIGVWKDLQHPDAAVQKD